MRAGTCRVPLKEVIPLIRLFSPVVGTCLKMHSGWCTPYRVVSPPCLRCPAVVTGLLSTVGSCRHHHFSSSSCSQGTCFFHFCLFIHSSAQIFLHYSFFFFFFLLPFSLGRMFLDSLDSLNSNHSMPDSCPLGSSKLEVEFFFFLCFQV